MTYINRTTNSNELIDALVRAHLDIIPKYSGSRTQPANIEVCVKMKKRRKKFNIKEVTVKDLIIEILIED